jgi:hypothetical protein
MLSADLIGLYESYMNVYNANDDSITEDLIEEIANELVDECVEFGYDLDESIFAVENALNEYLDSLDELDEATVTYGSDTESPQQRSARAKEKHSAMKSAARKSVVKGALERVKQKAKGAKSAASIAGSIAKDEVRRAGRTATHSLGKAASAVSTAAKKKKEQVKGGVKKLLGKGLRAVSGGAGKVAQVARKAGSAAGKAAEKLGEAAVGNRGLIDGRQKLADKAIDASGRKVPTHAKGLRMIPTRHSAARLPSGDLKTKAKNKGKKDAYYQNQRYGKGSMKIEELDLDIFDIVLEYLIDEGYAETISEAQFIMTQMDSESIEAIIETRMDPRGRPASGPMNVYANPKNKPSQAHLDAVKAHRESEAKKSPEQKKAELDAYIKRQRENK